jgi:hypothetical protein
MARAASSGTPPLAASAFLERVGSLELPPVVVLAGAERWFRDQAVRALLARVFPEGDPGGAVLRLDARDPGQKEQVAGAVDELRSASLFGAGRVVVVERPEAAGAAGAARDEDGGDEGAEEAAEEPAAGAPKPKRPQSPLLALALPALEAAVAGSVLVLSTEKPVKGKGAVPLATLQKKGALVVDCRPLYDAPGPWERGAPAHDHELARHLQRRAKARFRKSLGLVDAHALTRRVGSELSDLEQALETLALHAGTRTAVSAEDVDACFQGAREDPVWGLVDAVLDGRVADAVARTEHAFCEGFTDQRGVPVTRPEALFPLIFGALHAGYRRVLSGAEALARGEGEAEVLRAAGLPSFRGEAFLARCRRDPAAWLARHGAFLEAERGVRGGGVPQEVALERLVIALAAPLRRVPQPA